MRHRRDDVARVPRHRIEREAADLLEGRAPPDLKRLASLIRDVNPTGRDLSPLETRARYTLKSRLQSLLIRTYRDELRVVPDARGEHTVSLAHRFHPIDACHAVVADLDDDARAWVRWRLDTRDLLLPPPLVGAAVASATRDHDDPLRLGRAALAAFDFEAARYHMERAFAERPSVTAPHLIELLVDHLCDDEAALSLADQLDDDARSRSEVRARLGLAHARQGHRAVAEDIARAMPPSRAVDVYVALAREALLAEDAGYVRRMHEAARAVDPTRVELEALTEGVARLEVHERSSAEEALARAREAGARDEVARRAKAILARWPASEHARRALREIRDREHAEAMARHLGEAARALDAESLLEAKSAIEAARALGAVVGHLEARLGHALHLARARAEQERVDRVRGALGRGELAAALAEYLSLDDAQRRSVREGAAEPCLTWVDEIVASSRARPAQVVEAVIALRRAIEAEARGDLTQAASLNTHQKLLAACSAASALAERVAAARREELRRANRAVFDEARAAVSVGDTLKAQRQLTRLDPRLLGDEERAELPTMRARIGELNARSARAQALTRAEQAGELFAAMAHAAWLAAGSDGEERARWLEVERGLREREHVRSRRWERVGGAPAGILAARAERLDDVSVTLDAASGEFVVFNPCGPWLTVEEFDAATGRVVRSASLRLPASVEEYTAHRVGDRVLLATSGGHLAHLDRRTWALVAWRSEADVLDRASRAVYRHFSPDGAQIWYLTTSERRGSATVIVDIDTWTVAREIPGDHWVRTLPGRTGAMCLFDRATQRGDIVDAAGRSLVPIALEPKRTMFNFVEHPRGGFVALRATDRDSGGVRRDLCLSRAMPDGTFLDGPVITARCRGSGHDLVAALDAECLFALVNGLGDDRYLVAIDARDEACTELYSVRVPWRTVIFTDHEGARVVVVSDGVEGVDVVPLDRHPPRALRGRSWEAPRDVPDTAPPFGCEVMDVSGLQKSMRTLLTRVAGFNTRLMDLWVKGSAAPGKDPAHVAEVVRLLSATDRREAAHSLALALARRFPTHAEVALALAETQMYARRWQAALDALARAADDELRPHAWHVRGAAHAWLGDREAAERAWRRGVGRDAACGMAFCLDLLDASEPPDGADGCDSEREVLRAALALARRADACAARGDHAAAIRALDHRAVYTCSDAQLAARHALACLEHEPATPDEAYAQRCILADFVRICGDKPDPPLGDAPVVGAAWDVARIREVRDRARAWLDDEAVWRRWLPASRAALP